MRTALEMADHILGYTEDPEEIDRRVKRRIKFIQSMRDEVIRKGRDPDDLVHIPARYISSDYIPKSYLTYDDALEEVRAEIAKRAEYRPYCTGLFRPIERALGPNIGLAPGGDNDVLYAIISSGIAFARNTREIISSIFKPNVAVAFTANRCIIAHTNRKDGEMVRTIPYDDVTGIEPIHKSRKTNDAIILNTTIDSIDFISGSLNTGRLIISSETGRDIALGEFDPNQACEAVTELVMRYKQARYAAQQGTAAPQYSQQTPPPKAPQGEAPQIGRAHV